MKIFKKEPNFKFMDKRFWAFGISGLVIIAGLIAFFTMGFNLGIDFTGGTMVEVSFKDATSENDLRQILSDVGLGKSVIQSVEGGQTKFFIKTMNVSEEDLSEEEALEALAKAANIIREAFIDSRDKAEVDAGKKDLNNISERQISNILVAGGIDSESAENTAKAVIQLRTADANGLIGKFEDLEANGLKSNVVSILKDKTYLGHFTFLSVESVGPQVGHDLRRKATLATFWMLVGMLIYIGFRFKFIYGLAAVITLFHDVLIALAAIIFFQIEISLSVVAALLTIIGYSLNDTIVIFDRVRDNVKLMRKDPAATILDRSINQTLSRTIVTSGTTLLTVLSLFFFGGEVIHSFSFTLLVGVVVGTYSSIFQSCSWLKIWEKSFLGRKKYEK